MIELAGAGLSSQWARTGLMFTALPPNSGRNVGSKTLQCPAGTFGWVFRATKVAGNMRGGPVEALSP
ncbi:hypothetical protein K8P66_25810 [Klebsiella pneumoniae]|nr:hypothetical protein [Klebsiella pneumoniae]UPQ41835.1 hypothetical protein J8964_p00245 [Klebsiella pneumoniae]UPQ41974.1 hypothetical protein J8964_p01080 [Klebsiella pneumoniae]